MNSHGEPSTLYEVDKPGAKKLTTDDPMARRERAIIWRIARWGAIIGAAAMASGIWLGSWLGPAGPISGSGI